ncbi:hypothetical protein AAF712_007281 [Marasmius tenuissimus]|uniref:Uncharacterized protein n=1 Tax=Marasmius tenuissimus TaxID=585030 RepID=A0ABR2ZYB8_9AGAR
MLAITSAQNATRSTSDLMLLDSLEERGLPKLAQKPATYWGAIELVEKHYSTPEEDRIVFKLYTDSLKISQGQMVEITKEVWEAVRGELSKVYFQAEELQDPNSEK